MRGSDAFRARISGQILTHLAKPGNTGKHGRGRFVMRGSGVQVTYAAPLNQALAHATLRPRTAARHGRTTPRRHHAALGQARSKVCQSSAAVMRARAPS
jgi:hypothetical protein